MMDVTPDQARTLSAILSHGTFDAAARALAVTPSAVSQRIRALEVSVGRPVLRRTPLGLTETGEAVIRYARQLELLAADLATEIESDERGAGPRLTLVINGDSLHDWVLPALATLADPVQLEILREDEAHSVELLRQGVAAAAITATAEPVPGCSVRRLGIMRYRPVCAPDFAARWFPDGVNAAALAEAPIIAFDRKDDLQSQWLRRISRRRIDPPRHFVPASHEFANAIRLGLGWGMISDLEADRTNLVRMHPTGHVDVTLYWQQWRFGSAALQAVARAVQEAAQALS